MVNRWFYIENGPKIVSLGPMSMTKAREYEEHEARFLYTVTGLDMLREQITSLLRDPKNAKQLAQD